MSFVYMHPDLVSEDGAVASAARERAWTHVIIAGVQWSWRAVRGRRVKLGKEAAGAAKSTRLYASFWLNEVRKQMAAQVAQGTCSTELPIGSISVFLSEDPEAPASTIEVRRALAPGLATGASNANAQTIDVAVSPATRDALETDLQELFALSAATDPYTRKDTYVVHWTGHGLKNTVHHSGQVMALANAAKHGDSARTAEPDVLHMGCLEDALNIDGRAAATFLFVDACNHELDDTQRDPLFAYKARVASQAAAEVEITRIFSRQPDEPAVGAFGGETRPRPTPFALSVVEALRSFGWTRSLSGEYWIGKMEALRRACDVGLRLRYFVHGQKHGLIQEADERLIQIAYGTCNELHQRKHLIRPASPRSRVFLEVWPKSERANPPSDARAYVRAAAEEIDMGLVRRRRPFAAAINPHVWWTRTSLIEQLEKLGFSAPPDPPWEQSLGSDPSGHEKVRLWP